MVSIPRSIALTSVAAVSFVACGSSDAVGPTVGSSSDPAGSTIETTVVTAESNSGTGTETSADQGFPDIVDATATASSGGWTFDVTVSSPYDSADRYADGWRILGPDGTEYGFRLLTHDHASEQPFTRSLSDVQIPATVTVVTIEGRDQLNGFGGSTFELTLPDG